MEGDTMGIIHDIFGHRDSITGQCDICKKERSFGYLSDCDICHKTVCYKCSKNINGKTICKKCKKKA